MAHHKREQQVNRKALGIRTGDDVIVLSGSGKSKEPRKVLAVFTQERKVLVEGVNLMKDRQKAKGGSTRASGINQQDVVEKPFPIDRSKVALVDPKTKKATRIKVTTGADGKRTRTAVKSGETI
ncbi:MAG TPA: 50S ribosomal protein L24 [Abditibacteriaceae bacterium]|jgi:large subunit ribosomal protein L24